MSAAPELYYRDLVERVLELLKDNVGAAYGIKAYYEGDPVYFGQSSLPAICVLKQRAKYGWGPTQTDSIASTILIKLVLDKRDDYGASPDTDLTDKKLRMWIEGRISTTGEQDPQSLLGVLRGYTTLNDTNVNNPILNHTEDVQYHLMDRSTADDDLVTMEGHITLSADELVQVTRTS